MVQRGETCFHQLLLPYAIQVTMRKRHCQARALLLLMAVLCGLADLGHMYNMRAMKAAERLPFMLPGGPKYDSKVRVHA